MAAATVPRVLLPLMATPGLARRAQTLAVWRECLSTLLRQAAAQPQTEPARARTTLPAMPTMAIVQSTTSSRFLFVATTSRPSTLAHTLPLLPSTLHGPRSTQQQTTGGRAPQEAQITPRASSSIPRTLTHPQPTTRALQVAHLGTAVPILLVASPATPMARKSVHSSWSVPSCAV